MDGSESAVPTFTTFPSSDPPPPISIADLLSTVEVLQQKEANDKSTLEGIGAISSDTLRSKLVLWATAGFPNAYTLMEVVVNPPAQCSDGVVRNLTDYIAFCSGKTIGEHVEVLQAKVSGIAISFANLGYAIAIVVSKV